MPWLLVSAFVALPFLAALPYWLSYRRFRAALWFSAGVGVPAIVFIVCLKTISVGGEGSPGDGLGLLVVSGIVAAVAWLIISITALAVALARR
jgi:hypothetical protein